MDHKTLENEARTILGWSDSDIARARPTDIKSAMLRHKAKTGVVSPVAIPIGTPVAIPIGTPPIVPTSAVDENIVPLSFPVTLHTTVEDSMSISMTSIQTTIAELHESQKRIAQYETFDSRHSGITLPIIVILKERMKHQTMKLSEFAVFSNAQINEKQDLIKMVRDDLVVCTHTGDSLNLHHMEEAIKNENVLIGNFKRYLLLIKSVTM